MEDTTEVLKALRSCFPKLKLPIQSDQVFKDECVFSFDSAFSDGGLFVNVISYLGFGKEYLNEDIKNTGCRVYLHFKYTQILKGSQVKAESNGSDSTEVSAPPTKLAIGVEGGFMTDSSKYDIVKDHNIVVVMNGVENLVSIPIQYTAKERDIPSSISCDQWAGMPEFLLTVAKAIIDHDGMRSQLSVNTWEADTIRPVSKYALDLKQVNPANIRISQDPKQWRDEESGSSENLWLNLSTGYIGGGRKNWDGSGGSGSALNHFNATGDMYPLVVKLGTITPHGADVWSYADDEDNLVTDPYLAEHLSFWGIDIMKLEKTDKTLGEMEVSTNMSYNWSKVLDGQEELEIVRGPGFVGLTNIGSSCYMNALLQTLLTLPEVQERYFHNHPNIVATCSDSPPNDFVTQLSKVAVGVLSARYVPPTTVSDQEADYIAVSKVSLEEESQDISVLEKYVVAPRMFKYVTSKGHSEFSSGRQQDVSEYFMYLLEVMNKAERVHLKRLVGAHDVDAKTALPTASIFQFHLENRYQCTLTNQVRYSKQGQQSLNNILELRIPLDMAAVLQCLGSFFAAETVDLFNPTMQQIVPCLKTTRFKTFPRYLMVKLGRYYVGPNWVQVKINARVDVPEFLDLSAYRATGLQKQLGEVEMPETADEQTSRDQTTAMNWVFEHMEDPEFNDPVIPPLPKLISNSNNVSETSTARSALAAIDPEVISIITSMGYTEEQTRAALLATDYNIERAADWLFSHLDDLDVAVAEVLSTQLGGGGESTGGQSVGSSSDRSQLGKPIDADDGNGQYALVAVISHIGRNTDHGHYVCHVKKDNQWVLYNDDKVGKCKSAPLEHGFMYLFRRIDGSGSLLH
eukprot:gene26942-35638_t